MEGEYFRQIEATQKTNACVDPRMIFQIFTIEHCGVIDGFSPQSRRLAFPVLAPQQRI
jgi:hypothetical protein